MDKTEMRLDPLSQVWTIFSEARLTQPTFGSVLEENGADPFLAGREHFAPHPLHQEPRLTPWQVRVIPNRLPVLRIEGEPLTAAEGFYDRTDGVGAHEVVIEDAGNRALDELSLAEIQTVIYAWKSRISDLLKDPRLRSFTVVKNVGLQAGARTGHSLSQVLAMAGIFPRLKQKLQSARQFYAQKRRSIFTDILAEEVRVGTRLIYENHGFALFSPYAARSPFEVAIFPKRQNPDFHAISDQECAQLSDVLRTALRKLNRALNHPAYHLALTTAPARSDRRDHWQTLDRDFRWHIEITPRLDPLGGFELATGTPLNCVWPEVAASHLRRLEIPD